MGAGLESGPDDGGAGARWADGSETGDVTEVGGEDDVTDGGTDADRDDGTGSGPVDGGGIAGEVAPRTGPRAVGGVPARPGSVRADS